MCGSRWFVLCNKRRLRELCNSFRNIDGLSKIWMNIVNQGCHVSNQSGLEYLVFEYQKTFLVPNLKLTTNFKALKEMDGTT